MTFSPEPSRGGSRLFSSPLLALLFSVPLLGSLIVSPSPTHATTYILVPDAALARQADLIVEGRIRSGTPAPTLPPSTTRSRSQQRFTDVYAPIP